MHTYEAAFAPAATAADATGRRRGLDGGQLRTLGISMLGGALEYYEFLVFVFMVPVLGQVFFPPGTSPWLRSLQTLGIFAAGYVIRPFGGLILGVFGDRLGRKRMFIVTLALMALPTLGIGLLPTYAQIGVAAPLLLLLCRLCQGLAMGGEIPTALTFVVEHVDEKRTGLAIGILGAGLCAGTLMGILMVALMGKAFTQHEVVEFAWRVPFVLGGVFGLLSAALRRFVSETPVFAEMADRKKLGESVPLREVFVKYRRELLIAFAASLASNAIVQVASLFPVTFFQAELNFPAPVVHQAQLGFIAVSMFSVVISNWLMDRIGWTLSIALVAVGQVVCALLVYSAPTVENLAWHMALSGIPIAIVMMLNNHLVRVFPAQVRITGIAAAHNIATALAGGVLPVAMGALAHVDHRAMIYVPAVFALLAVVLTPIAVRYRKPLRFVDA
jgi:MFS family permease